MLTFTDNDILEYTLMRPYQNGQQQDFKAIVLELINMDYEQPMVFFTKEDLENMIKLFDEGIVNET